MLISFLSSLTIALCAALLPKLFPVKSSPVGTLSFDELARKYRFWRVAVIGSHLLFTTVFGSLTWIFLRTFARFHASFLPSADVTIIPSDLYWAVPAAVFGMATSYFPTGWSARRLMQKPYSFEEYLHFSELLNKTDTRASLRATFGFIGVIFFPFIFLGLNWHVQLSGESFVVKPYWSLHEKRYDVHQIRQIRTAAKTIAPNGKTVGVREYAVTFDNGDIWTTDVMVNELSLTEKRYFVGLLSARSGVQIGEVEFLTTREKLF
jgi:hypothetical protein